MDDHMFEWVREYGNSWLVPRFQSEYEKYKEIKKCPSYEEIKDFCKVMNILAKWGGYGINFTPSYFLNYKI